MWETGVMNGDGQIVTEKDYVIEARFKMGQLHGPGKRKYKSGKTLTGEWEEGDLVTGTMTNADGTTYEGAWVGGRPHGSGVKTIPGGKRYEGQFSVGRPWGKGCKVSGSKREEGYWEKAKFVKGETPPEKEAQFNEQLDQIRTYYKVFKKFHAHELPKTNYDVLKEERAELHGDTERELIAKLNTDYKKLLNQGQPIERQFSILEANLYDHAEVIEEKPTPTKKKEDESTASMPVLDKAASLSPLHTEGDQAHPAPPLAPEEEKKQNRSSLQRQMTHMPKSSAKAKSSATASRKSQETRSLQRSHTKLTKSSHAKSGS